MSGNSKLRLALGAASKLKVVSDYPVRIAELKSQYAHNVSILPDGKHRIERFNCFAYALGLWDNADYICMVDAAMNSAIVNSSLMALMIDDGTLCEISMSAAVAGDMILYLSNDRPTHAAVIASVGPPLMLRSKWGGNEVHQHGLWEVPADYGDSVRAYKVPATAICLDRLRG
jgi:hypothetical protein